MKKTSKIISIVLAIMMMVQLPITALADVTTYSPYTNATYTHQDRYVSKGITHGIDVSVHNGTIDWNAVKANGIEYAIIRAGYRAYSKTPTGDPLHTDANFEANIQGAIAAGLEVGVYFYSQALNEAEAISEAERTLSILGTYPISLPIFYDYEFAGTSAGRLDSAWSSGAINQTIMTNNAIAFCNTIRAAGHEAMVYASKTFLETQLNNAAIQSAGYGTWLAHYNTNTNYAGEFDYWQYSSRGRVAGINGNVDMNFRYNGFAISPIANQTYNGLAQTPEVTVSYQGVVLTQNVDYTLEYVNNVEMGVAYVNIVGINSYATVSPRTVSFFIVPPACTNLVPVSSTTNTVFVAWDVNPYAETYSVEYSNGATWTSAGVATSNTYTLSKLNPSTTYAIRVAPIRNVNGVDCIGEYITTYALTAVDKTNGLATSASSKTTVTLNWNKQAGVSGYRIYRYNYSTSKYDFIGEVYGDSNITYKATGLPANTKCRFKVRAFIGMADGSRWYGAYSDGFTVYTKPAGTSLKSLAKNGKKKILVKWTSKSGVSGYQIQWSTSKSFASNKKSVTFSGASKKSRTITTSKSKKKYYVRIRTYKTRNGVKLYSAWSSAKSITTK